MKNSIFYSFIIIILLSFIGISGCVINKIENDHLTISLKESVQGRPVHIEIRKGEYWSREMKVGPVIFNVLPQIAIWAETPGGEFLETIYVTGAQGKGVKHAGKREKGADFYSECFPLWASRILSADESLPSMKNPYPDTITSATPTSGFTLQTKLKRENTDLVIFLEINKSDDTNTVYTEEKNDWAGQPSLIYSVPVNGTASGRNYVMTLAGHGGLIKDEPDLYTDMSGFDTALRQVKSISVRFE